MCGRIGSEYHKAFPLSLLDEKGFFKLNYYIFTVTPALVNIKTLKQTQVDIKDKGTVFM